MSEVKPVLTRKQRTEFIKRLQKKAEPGFESGISVKHDDPEIAKLLKEVIAEYPNHH